jgi:hypothetical protein
MLWWTALMRSSRWPSASAAARWTPGALGLYRSQPGPEELREQVVVPVPAAGAVELHQEEVAGPDPIEHLDAVVSATDGVTQRSIEGLELGRHGQELDDLRRLELDHLGHEEVDEASVGADQPPEEPGRVSMGPEPEPGQVHGGRPTFGDGDDLLEIPVSHLDAQPAEELTGLVAGEPQVGLAQLQESALHAQPPDRERGVLAAAQHEARLGRQRADERLHHRRFGAGQVEVVDDDDPGFGEGGQLVGEADGELVALPGVGELGHRRAEVGPGLADDRRQVVPEGARIRVGAVARHPGDRAVQPADPLGEQGGLAGTGGGDDERQRAVDGGAELLDQGFAGDGGVGHSGNPELRPRHDRFSAAHRTAPFAASATAMSMRTPKVVAAIRNVGHHPYRVIPMAGLRSPTAGG